MRWTNCSFCFIWARMNYFAARLMTKYSRWYWLKSKMATPVFEILDRFSLVWVPMYQQSKSAFLLGTWTLNISNRHFRSIFWHSVPYKFGERYHYLVEGSLWCVLLHNRPINTSKSDWWILLLWGKFELECLVVKFMYFDSKVNLYYFSHHFAFFSSKFFK